MLPEDSRGWQLLDVLRGLLPGGVLHCDTWLADRIALPEQALGPLLRRMQAAGLLRTVAHTGVPIGAAPTGAPRVVWRVVRLADGAVLRSIRAPAGAEV